MHITEEEIQEVFRLLGVPYDKSEYKGVEFYWDSLIRSVPREIHHQTRVMKAKNPVRAAALALAKDWDIVLPKLTQYLEKK